MTRMSSTLNTLKNTRDPFLAGGYAINPMAYVPKRINTLVVPKPVAPALEPPRIPLCLEDMEGDINRLIKRIAIHNTDESCMFLKTDELEAECRYILANVLRHNWLERAKDRVAFFKVLKSAFLNRVRSLIQQHRYTQKRTGIKPPPKHERRINFASTKPNEISLDDPEAHLQVAEKERGIHEDDMDTRELIREIQEQLPPLERMVFNELRSPCRETLVFAWEDAHRGTTNPDRMKIDIRQYEHMADGLNIPLDLFKKAVLRVQETTLRCQKMNPEDQRYETVVARLAQ